MDPFKKFIKSLEQSGDLVISENLTDKFLIFYVFYKENFDSYMEAKRVGDRLRKKGKNITDDNFISRVCNYSGGMFLNEDRKSWTYEEYDREEGIID
jgi:hypothetical protein